MQANRDHTNVKRTAAMYNLVVNLFWSALSLVPLTVFCYTKLDLHFFLLFSGASIAPVFFSNSFFNHLPFVNSLATSKKLGVALVQRFSQNGIIVNHLIRKKHPGYKVLQWDPKSINRLLNQTYAFEKFHWALFVFFSLASFYALRKGFVGWSVFLLLANLFYNVCPILLQQYIRMKLVAYNKKNQHALPAGTKDLAQYRKKCFGQFMQQNNQPI